MSLQRRQSAQLNEWQLSIGMSVGDAMQFEAFHRDGTHDAQHTEFVLNNTELAHLAINNNAYVTVKASVPRKVIANAAGNCFSWAVLLQEHAASVECTLSA